MYIDIINLNNKIDSIKINTSDLIINNHAHLKLFKSEIELNVKHCKITKTQTFLD